MECLVAGGKWLDKTGAIRRKRCGVRDVVRAKHGSREARYRGKNEG